jgi:hypothetical protein
MDVETILSEIRERVLADENVTGAGISRTSASSNRSLTAANQNEALARVSEHLTVTARASNQLPPLISNRSGTLARLELWIKRTSKPLTRWFTWEQINFNRATHHALLNVLEILVARAQELSALRAAMAEAQEQLRRETSNLRELLEIQTADLRSVSETNAKFRSVAEAGIKETESRLRNLLTELTEQHNNRHMQLADKINEVAEAVLQEQRAGKSEQDHEMNRRLADLAAELKEEQRVCFRQLSLEASESAILEDRGRRAIVARLEKLEKSLESQNH